MKKAKGSLLKKCTICYTLGGGRGKKIGIRDTFQKHGLKWLNIAL